MKTSRGFGFTIIGGDDSETGGCGEFLQVKSVSPNSPAAADGKLCASKRYSDLPSLCKSDKHSLFNASTKGCRDVTFSSRPASRPTVLVSFDSSVI